MDIVVLSATRLTDNGRHFNGERFAMEITDRKHRIELFGKSRKMTAADVSYAGCPETKTRYKYNKQTGLFENTFWCNDKPTEQINAEVKAINELLNAFLVSPMNGNAKYAQGSIIC